MKPIKREEIKKAVKKDFPDVVIESFNELISENWDNKKSVFSQNDVMDRILKKDCELKRHEVYENKWLDVEDYYRECGWTVVYNKPPYYDSSSPTFSFS